MTTVKMIAIVDTAIVRNTVIAKMKGSIDGVEAVQIAKMAPTEEKILKDHKVKNLKEIRRMTEVANKGDAHALVLPKVQLRDEVEKKMKMIGIEDVLHGIDADIAATQAIAAIKINKEMKPMNSTRRKRRKSR